MSSVATIAFPAGTAPAPIYALNRDLGPRDAAHGAFSVFVVDGDVHVRQALEYLIRSQGWLPQTCASSQEFLTQPRQLVPSCLILAFSSTDSNGLEVQKRIAKECAEIPIVVIADYEDIPTTVESMKAGAVDFLVKPFGEELLLDAIRHSLARSRAALDRAMEMRELRHRCASLTPRERQVMALVVSGLLNKQVGAELGISEITVKAHRGQVMQKMKADSLAQLVNMALRLRLTKTPGAVSM
ncbi:MAG: LuxR C-terminal-related transcriptional regulator [Acidobacteriaceae bacterium]